MRVRQVRSWQQAWEEALARPDAFYRLETGNPSTHFHTDAMDGTSAVAVVALVRALLDRPRPPRSSSELIPGSQQVRIIDVGAGDGSLLSDVLALLPGQPIEAIGIDLRDRPAGLDERIRWQRADARTVDLPTFDGILLAHEFLDDIPCAWVECDAHGNARLVVVDADGATELGPRLDDDIGCRALGVEAAAIREWRATWWPVSRPLARCEVGKLRDATWARLTSRIRNGYAVAIDYGHLLDERMAGVWDGGTISGYRRGRVVSPRLDGSCNLTAHVSMDAIASAAIGARWSSLERTHHDFWRLTQAFGATARIRP